MELVVEMGMGGIMSGAVRRTFEIIVLRIGSTIATACLGVGAILRAQERYWFCQYLARSA